jgi:hypothetical protein
MTMLELILIGSLSAELTESNVVKKFNVAQVLGSIFYLNQYLVVAITVPRSINMSMVQILIPHVIYM